MNFVGFGSFCPSLSEVVCSSAVWSDDDGQFDAAVSTADDDQAFGPGEKSISGPGIKTV